MADLYVRGDGSNTSPYDTWAKAATSFETAVNAAAAGDRIFVADGFTETLTATTTFDLPGDPDNITVIASVDDTGDPEPPTALATGAKISGGTGNYGLYLIGGGAYVYGMEFESSSNGSSQSVIGVVTQSGAANEVLILEDCTFTLQNTRSDNMRFGAGTGSSSRPQLARLINPTFSFNNANNRIQLYRVLLDIRGMTLAGTAPTTLFSLVASLEHIIDIYESDLSGLSFTNLLDFNNAQAAGYFRISNSKVPSGITFGTGTIFGPAAMILEAVNVDSGDTNYTYYYKDWMGTFQEETTIVLDASDGTTTLSWAMATTADANKFLPLVSPGIPLWNEDTGSAKTIEVEVVTDNVTLQDDEAWIEVEHLGTSGFPKSVIDLDDRAADLVFATAANQATSTAAWTTTGLTTPVKQKLTASVTPQEKGPMMVRVHLGKPSTTVYVNPKVTVS